MILEFKTPANKSNEHRHYLAIDTGAECYSRFNPYMITQGIEIKTRDYRELIEKLKRLEYKEVERVY
jgi:hypothetical protein